MIHLMFARLHELVNQNDLIFTDQYSTHASQCETCFYHVSSLIFRSNFWREKYQKSLLRTRIADKKLTLLLGHSDELITSKVYFVSKLKGFNSTWSTNARPYRNKLFSLPLGLSNPTRESPLHEIAGDTDLLLEALKFDDNEIEFNSNYYANFTVATNPIERQFVIDVLKRIQIKIHNQKFDRNGRLQYLKGIRQSTFVICPEGNGVDTHRLWETLYLGRIPIIKNNLAISSLISDLPVLVVDDWNELLDHNLVEHKYRSLRAGDFKFEKLSARYWIERFCKSR
jgi:hypothetical protein